MTVRIKLLGVEVPGQVTRKFDGAVTTLMLNEDQVRVLYAELGPVLQFFDAQPPGESVPRTKGKDG
jgi:hypothetical protein